MKVGDDEVQVAVAVDVGPGGAATDLADGEGRAARFPERDELAVHLLEHEVVLLVSRKASLVVFVEVKVLPEMPIGDEQIQIAVVVGIEEAGPPRQVLEGGLSGAQGPRHFGEPKSPQIPVEIVHLGLVVGLHEVEPSISTGIISLGWAGELTNFSAPAWQPRQRVLGYGCAILSGRV